MSHTCDQCHVNLAATPLTRGNVMPVLKKAVCVFTLMCTVCAGRREWIPHISFLTSALGPGCSPPSTSPLRAAPELTEMETQPLVSRKVTWPVLKLLSDQPLLGGTQAKYARERVAVHVCRWRRDLT